MIFAKCLGFVCCLVVSFGQGFSYGVGPQFNSRIPDQDAREIGENFSNLNFLKHFITEELDKKPNNYEYNGFHTHPNKPQPYHNVPSYAGNRRPHPNDNYEFSPQNFGNNIRGHNHPNHGFQNEKYDILGPFPVDFGPGFQHSEEYHRKIGDKRFTIKPEKPLPEYAVIEIYEQPDLPDPNVKLIVPSTRKPKLDEPTTQKSAIITSSELSNQEPPCFDRRNAQTGNSPGFHSADCFGLPRGRPRRPPPPPRPSTTVAPVSVDPRVSPLSIISTSPSIDIRAKFPSGDKDSIVFPDD